MEITQGMVPHLRVYSARIKKTADYHTVVLILSSRFLSRYGKIYCSAMKSAGGEMVCINESNLTISQLARKEIRHIVKDIAQELLGRMDRS